MPTPPDAQVSDSISGQGAASSVVTEEAPAHASQDVVSPDDRKNISLQNSSENARELARWQRKLLPFMATFLILLALIFFGTTVISVYGIRSAINGDPGQAIRPVRESVEQLLKDNTSRSSPDLVVQGLLLLEADALDNRYREAAGFLASRLWTRQLAFLTGMVLAFTGSIFILGRLSTSVADVNIGQSAWKASISSTSPGLILAFLGSLLMGIALIVQPPIDVKDAPVYFGMVGLKQNASGQSASEIQQPNNSSAPAKPNTPDPNPFGR